jgi:hypothetical protein
VDPESLNPDMGPDPAFQVNPYTDPDPTRIQGFDDQKFKEKIQLIFSFFFCLKFAIYLSPGLHKGRPSYRRSLSTLALLDPDPDCESGSGYGSRDLIESGSTTLITEPSYPGPDPKFRSMDPNSGPVL